MTFASRQLRVFLCHAVQDKPVVRELQQRLAHEGWIDPWLDEKKLHPGEDWRLSIENAVESSDLVVVCLSDNSVNKEGFVQKELRYAREIALEKPEGTLFLIPLRLEDCNVPRGLRFFQWTDYFGEKKGQSYTELLESFSIRHQQVIRREQEKGGKEEKAQREAEELTKHETDKKKAVQPNRISDFGQGIRSAPGLALLGLVLTVLVGLFMNWMGLFNGVKPEIPTMTLTPTLTIIQSAITNTPQPQPYVNRVNTTITAAPLVAVTVESTRQAGSLLSPTVNLVSQMGGASNAIVIQDKIAYLGEGPRITILDVSDPTHPARIAQTPVLYDVIQKIAVSRTTVYVIVGNNRISIIDVAAIKNPKVLGSYDDPSNSISDIAIEGNLAFILGSGLRIVDVSNPAKLAEVGFFDVGDKFIETALRVKGNYAYVINNGGLYVVDISDPGNPRQVGFVGFEPNESASAIEIIDAHAYVSGSNFWMIDISNPSNPKIVANTKSSYASAIQVNGNYLYLQTNARVQVFDIHHPTDPLLLGSYPVDVCDIAQWGSYVFVAECQGGMRVMDVSNAAEPTEVSAYGLGAFGKKTVSSYSNRETIDSSMVVRENYAYLAMDYCFQVVDISDLSYPQVIGILNGMPKYTKQVVVDGNYAYVLTFAGGITVVNISNPTSPTLVNVLPLPQYSWDFVMGEGYLYEISNDIDAGAGKVSGMRVIDISDPAKLAVVGQIVFDEEIYSVSTGGQFAYVASHEKLYVVNVSDPANPTVVTSQNRGVNDLSIRENYAYIVGPEGLGVLDISDTKDIWRVGLCSVQNCGYDYNMVLIGGDYALMGSLTYGGDLTLVDISDLANPFKVVSLRQVIGNTGRILEGSIVLDGNYIYKVSADGGLFILSISK